MKHISFGAIQTTSKACFLVWIKRARQIVRVHRHQPGTGGRQPGPRSDPGRPQRCFAPAGVGSLGRKRGDPCAPQPTQRGQVPRLLAPPSPAPARFTVACPGSVAKPDFCPCQNRAALCPFPLGLWKLTNWIDRPGTVHTGGFLKPAKRNSTPGTYVWQLRGLFLSPSQSFIFNFPKKRALI